MKKKIFMLAVAMIAGAASMMADQIIQSGDLYYSLGTTTATVVKDQSSENPTYKEFIEVTIPASVTYDNYTYPVKYIGTSAFEYCTKLQRVTLPESITTIYSDAFYGCSKLGDINLPEGLTNICKRAFYNCNLDTITIPSTVNNMDEKVFYGNPLEKIVWKPITCSIYGSDNAPFYNATSKVTSFVFGEQVETIPGYLCKGMSMLDTIVLPPSVKSLGTYAFAYCTNLKSINLPATQKSLPSSLLEGCSSLETIELPATLTTIGDDVFYGCSKLKEINLHEGITTINQRAFYNCKLTSVTIPSTVTSMGSKVFYGNPLEEVVWKPITCSVYSGDNAPFYNATSKVTSFVFDEKVETIPGSLCKNMILLENVVIPESVTSIGSYAFAYCSALKQFEFPKGIKTVTSSVLEGCTNLGEVKIPASVTTIGSDAFYGCKNLTAIYNYAITPQSITANTVYNVNKSTCILYVPMDYINLYKEANVWKEFLNIVGVATDLQFEEQLVNVTYLKQDESLHHMEAQKWQVPHEPYIEGFTFVGWRVLPGMLDEGIVLQAVYTSDDPTQAPEVYVNPANQAQKLIRDGNVYILRDDRIYTMQGQVVK